VPYFDLALSAQVKVAEPPGEALPNAEIFRRLAGAMGYDEPELFEPDRAIIDRVIASTGLVGSFEELAAAGTVKAFAEPALQFADGVFPTPSGRIELVSAAAEADGHPRTALPLTDAPPAAGRLRLLTPASPWTMNGTFANDPKVARRLGEAVVEVHPDEAAARGLRAGDRVVLGNETGRLALRLEVGEHVPPGVALSAKGRWPGREPQGANVNVLNDGRRTDMGESSAVHGVEVSLERAPQ
jgi:anaerobic selenocysteine-containing dehydrogenase